MRILPEPSQWSPYPMGVLASIPADASFFDEATAPIPRTRCDRGGRFRVRDGGTMTLLPSEVRHLDDALEMGLAATAHVQEISDGIPITSGAEECTKPTEPPKASTPYDGRARITGVRW